jgi:tetratricopeptide (TPR) repeat protein
MKPSNILLTAAAILSFTITALHSQERFDFLVRGDFFAGFAGNAEALERAMKVTEEKLKENPNHAEALVWHGSGLFYQSGQLMNKKDFAKGMELYGRGIAEMNKAVELEPKNIGVRIPRGAVLSAGARFMPAEMAKPLFLSVIDDYYTVYQMQEKYLDKIGTHPRGELLFGLADSFSRIGATAKADHFFAEIQKSLPNSAYSKRADKWFETKQPLPAAQANCIGCHTFKHPEPQA